MKTIRKDYVSLWQTINHEILANPNQTDTYSCLLLVDSHENWTIGVSSDENFGIFKVPNMFMHIICLYCIRVHLSGTISGHPILLFLDV